MDESIKQRIDLLLKNKHRIQNSKIIHLLEHYQSSTNFIKEFGRILCETEYSQAMKAPKILLEVHSGTGGDDARELAETLFTSYYKFLLPYKVSIVDTGHTTGLSGIGTGVLTAEIPLYEIQGENGIHRIVRVHNGKKQTSFISVNIYPVLPQTNLEIDSKDLLIRTCRASGAGGQHVNKTESAVSITHLPSKITIRCENERSQHANKQTAMQLLLVKLQQKHKKEDEKNRNVLDRQDNTWSNQFRNYCFYGQKFIQDNRVNIKITSLKAMDRILYEGDFGIFTQAFILQNYIESLGIV